MHFTAALFAISLRLAQRMPLRQAKKRAQRCFLVAGAGDFFHILKLHEYLLGIFIFLLNFVLQAVSSQDNNIFN
jgi:hypothetical protein